MEWEDWDKQADRATSGDMVRDILTDWKADKETIRIATLKAVGEYFRLKSRFYQSDVDAFLRGEWPE